MGHEVVNIPTFEELQNMSEAEVAELNAKLTIRAFRNLALLMAAKWGLIFGVTYVVKKALDGFTEEMR